MSRVITLDKPSDRYERFQGRTGWSASRLVGGFVLAAWAAMFWFLFLTGRANLYMSTRTLWLVSLGAVLFSIAAIGRLISARAASEPLRRRDALAMAIMMVPVILVLTLPPATLGQFSAGKKTAFSSLSYAGMYGQITDSSEITLLSIAAGQTSKEGSQALAKRAGSDVDFVGFVVRNPDTPADELLLTRYVITCCTADATIVQVRVVNVTPGQFAPDDWVEVKGQIFPLGREVILNAQSVSKVATPAKPYLTP